ncbi:MAG: TlpA family protein disulfide reductase [Saprospiraceae bacterium]|nr:TlpA family protein disulfide reductase [Saprospiraceae bacterium]
MFKYLAVVMITTLFMVSCNNGTTKNQDNTPEYTPEEVVQTDEPKATEQPVSLDKLAYKDVPFTTLDQKEIKISDYKGKRVLLNFWATWCRPCVGEMPSMNKAFSELSDENYVFLAASNERIAKINSFTQSVKYDFTFIKADDQFRPFNVQVIPMTLIFDTNGEVAMTLTGSMAWDEAEILKQLRAVK